LDPLALGLSLGIGAGLSPGPLVALVVRATLERGFSAGARVAFAPLITDAPIVALCVLVLRELPDHVLAGLSIAGAAFVGWLAWDALRAEAAEPPRGGGDLRRAVVVNALSPHPWLFWLAVGGPLLVEAGHRSAALAVAFLGGFYAMLVASKLALAGLVAAGRSRLAGSRAVRLVSAALLAAAAVALLADGVSRLVSPSPPPGRVSGSSASDRSSRRSGPPGPPRRLVRGQHSVAVRSAPHSSRSFAGARVVMRSVSIHFGTVARLSSVSAQRAGMPSARVRCTSVGMSRIVRVAGATRTVFSTGIAARRVRTHAGRRPASGCSSHQTSPRSGPAALTTAPRR
jgi:threonine/homoserine/homoserine lactone efflux protein